MPFVRITLPKLFSAETKDKLSFAVHQSLITHFNIPEDDYFHVIEELEPANIKFPKKYLDIEHSEQIVYVQITAGQGRTLVQKQGLYKSIAEKISANTEISKNNIIIVLTENNGKENWSFGNGEIQEQKHLK